MSKALTKLTLNAPPEIIELARRLSKVSGQSISAMFILFIKRYGEKQFSMIDEETLSGDSNAEQALEIGRQGQTVPPDWDYKDELSGILSSKYGLKGEGL